jgi:predicted nucleic-acid-binding protein
LQTEQNKQDKIYIAKEYFFETVTKFQRLKFWETKIIALLMQNGNLKLRLYQLPY